MNDTWVWEGINLCLYDAIYIVTTAQLGMDMVS